MGSGFLSGIRSGIKVNQDEAVEAGQSIRAKKQMISDAFPPATPAPVSSARPVGSSPIDRVKPGAKFGSRSSEKRIDVSPYMKPLGSFKKGGKVKKTGVYKLHAKERVLNAKQTQNLAGLAKGLSK